MIVKYDEPVTNNANTKDGSHPNSFLRKYEKSINCKRLTIKIKTEKPTGDPENMRYGIVKK